jgi:glycosyltransferase involved in cell wall biosynthesis
MLILGICKVRNEEKIIQETLDHWGSICTGGIYIYDDCSTDKTVEICEKHKAVKDIFKGNMWDADRERAEYVNRQRILMRAQQDAAPDDWFVYFDADERMYFDKWSLLFAPDVKAIACRLYDVYITPEDVIGDYKDRQFVGPEYRTIIFFFKNSQFLSYDQPDQRNVNLEPGIRVPIEGIVKHYGKGLSIEHWEDTCDYYINFWPKYAEKWQARKGKAVHEHYRSDFGNQLIKFNKILSGKEIGFPLESQPYGLN